LAEIAKPQASLSVACGFAILRLQKSMCDVVVIGGGVIGLSIAYELAGEGLSVRVLEQGQIGQEASWAGAGILPPGNSDWAQTAEARLRAASCRLWPQWAERLREESGIDTGFLRCGGLEPRLSGPETELSDDIAHWQREGVEIEDLSAASVRERFPAVNPEVSAAYFLPQLCQVRNPWLLQALQAACVIRGVELRPGCPVTALEANGERIHTVRTSCGDFSAGQFVIAAGAWSRELVQQAGVDLNVEPIRGQIVLLEARPLPFSCVIQHHARYLVPRRDGRILVGSTEEHAGFDKRNTAGAVAELIAFASELVPVLAAARFERAWAGLRPCIEGGAPYIGRVPQLGNVLVATGHFRAGLQLSPITAVLVRELITGQPPSLPLDCQGVMHGKIS
jgi:glycine oxidase